MLSKYDEKPFVVQPASLGVRAGVTPARLQELGDELEIDAFLNLTDRLSNFCTGLGKR